MTNQEAFTTMVQHARKQREKSLDDLRQTCLYRGPRGLKCFVGALIPDADYREEWDHAGSSVKRIKFLVPCLTDVSTDLLETMQLTHDHILISNWERRFSEIADEYHLSFAPLEASHA